VDLIVYEDHKQLYRHMNGTVDVDKKKPVSADQRYLMFSMTKVQTMTAVMQLVEQGLLDLDTDISEYLGYDVRNPYYPKSRLTLRSLMTHTSSLSVGGGYSKVRNTLRKLISTDKKQTGNFHDEAPGTVYRYSNFGAGIMGSLIEAVSQQNINDYMSEHVFQPLGIDAGYHATLVGNPEAVTYIYNRGGTRLITGRKASLKDDWDASVNPDKHYRITVGSLWINGQDLCRLGMLLLNGGELNGVRLLKEETVREMMSSQKGKGCVTIDSPYGLCINRVDNLLDDRMIYGHQGMSGDICANLYFDPQSSLVFAMVTNGCNNKIDDHICAISRKLFAAVWDVYGD
jgi:CubicO group peptidase (beta-lactamase class C family)